MNSLNRIFTIVLIVSTNLLYGASIVPVVCFNTNSQINITAGTSLIINGNLNSNADISGNGVIVIAKNPTAQEGGYYINMNGFKIQNLRIDASVNLLGSLKIENSLEIRKDADLVLNQYNLYINSIAIINSCANRIINNDIGRIIFSNPAIIPQPLAHNCVAVPDVKNLVILVENVTPIKSTYAICNRNMLKILYSSIKSTPPVPPPIIIIT